MEGTAIKEQLDTATTGPLQHGLISTLESEIKQLKHMLTLLQAKNQYLADRVSEKDQIEYYLTESERRFRLLAENSTDMISRHSPQGKLLYISPACENMLQYKPQELVNTSLFDLLHHSDIAISQKISHAITHRTPFLTLTYRIRKKGGDHVWVESNIKLIQDEKGQVIELQAATRDITKHIIEERYRQHGEQLAQVFRMTTMEEMASGMAHEINQPLAAVINYTQGCIRHLQNCTSSPEELIEVMHKAAQQAERAGDIVHHLKSFFCKGQLFKEPWQVNVLIRDAVRFNQGEINRANTKIKYELSKKLPDIYVDRIQLQQVILNVIQNALESLEDIDPSTRTINIYSGIKNHNTIHVTISDNGPGFPPTYQEKYATPFFTTKKHGTGMGLAICRSIIEAHGGKLIIITNDHYPHGMVEILLPIDTE